MRLRLVIFGKTRNRQGLGVNHVRREEDRNQLRMKMTRMVSGTYRADAHYSYAGRLLTSVRRP